MLISFFEFEIDLAFDVLFLLLVLFFFDLVLVCVVGHVVDDVIAFDFVSMLISM